MIDNISVGWATHAFIMGPRYRVYRDQVELNYDETSYRRDIFMVLYNVPMEISDSQLKTILKTKIKGSFLLTDLDQELLKGVSVHGANETPQPNSRHLVIFFSTLKSARIFALHNPELWIGKTPILCVYLDKKNSEARAMGSQDVGDYATSFVLVRGLHESMDEPSLYKTFVDHGYRPNRVMIIRSRINLQSCGYAFVEFESNDAAASCIDNAYGIAALGRSFTMHRIHSGVFKPVEPGQPLSYCFKNLAGHYMYYWDVSLYASEYTENILAEDLEPKDELPAKSKKKRKVDLSIRQAPDGLLKTWQSRQNELRPKQNEPSTSTLEQSFANYDKKTCVLCLRKFPSTHELNAHERMSNLHLYNLADPSKVRKAEKIKTALAG